MTDTWDDDDRAIARALGADPADGEAIGADATFDDRAVAEYEAVLAHLPFDAVAPPPDLEERVVAAALARRPATASALDGRRTIRDARRSASPRWIGAGAAVVAAAAIIVALAVSRPATGPSTPGARIQPASATESVAQVLAERGTRAGALRTGKGTIVGRVALSADGQGFLYDLSKGRSSPPWLWLETASGPVFVGRLPVASTVHVVVHGNVDAVKGVFFTDDATPRSPSASAELS